MSKKVVKVIYGVDVMANIESKVATKQGVNSLVKRFVNLNNKVSVSLFEMASIAYAVCNSKSMKQKDFANAVGVSEGTVSKYVKAIGFLKDSGKYDTFIPAKFDMEKVSQIARNSEGLDNETVNTLLESTQSEVRDFFSKDTDDTAAAKILATVNVKGLGEINILDNGTWKKVEK